MKRYDIMKYFVFRRFSCFSDVCLRFAYFPAVCALFSCYWLLFSVFIFLKRTF